MYTTQIGLRMNFTRAESVRIGTNLTIPDESFCYLGDIICSDGGLSDDIWAWINRAAVAFQSLYKEWRSDVIG